MQLMGLRPADRDLAAPITFVTAQQLSDELCIDRRNLGPRIAAASAARGAMTRRRAAARPAAVNARCWRSRGRSSTCARSWNLERGDKPVRATDPTDVAPSICGS